ASGVSVAVNVFNIQPQVVSVVPAAGSVGTVVTIYSTGYASGETVNVAFGTNAAIQTVAAGQYGSWTTSWTVDTQGFGTTTITASGATAGGAKNVFNIYPQVVSVVPTAGSIGTVVTIYSTGYASGETVNIAFGTNAAIQTAFAGQYGSWTTSWTVDVQGVGTTTITASGVSTATNVFNIQPQVVSVVPTAGTVGTIVTIYSTGYAAGEIVKIAFGTNASIQTAVAGQYGSFTTSWTVDVQAYGTTTITTNGVGVATNVFNIQPQVVSVVPTAGTVGTIVTIYSTGYAAGETVNVAFGTNAAIQTAAAGQYGSWTTSWTVDVQGYGTTTITASGVSVAVNVFNIQPQVVSVVPAAGTVGTIVMIYSTGYAAGETVNIAFGTNASIQTVAAGQYGSWTTNWIIDVQGYGTTTITASGISAAANVFNIQPQIVSVVPTAGTVGTIVTIYSTGYAAGETVNVAFGTNAAIQTAQAGTYGSFTTSFMVDTQRYGTTTIIASGASTATNVFSIQPHVVSVLPTQGSVGTIVTISCTGYGP
ncbi:MAG: hypothetical protein AAB110_01645, partial [Candidatus Desantisbacteria bacterium]